MKLYGGIDLHSNNHVVVLSDEEDRIAYRKRLPNDLETVLRELSPYREQIAGLVVESAYGGPDGGCYCTIFFGDHRAQDPANAQAVHPPLGGRPAEGVGAISRWQACKAYTGSGSRLPFLIP